jgi:hypothetical protein
MKLKIMGDYSFMLWLPKHVVAMHFLPEKYEDSWMHG